MEKAIVYNNIIVDVATEFNVPLINLWAITQGMPDYGIDTTDFFHLSHPSGVSTILLTGEENTYGLNARNYWTLEALHQIRTQVIGG